MNDDDGSGVCGGMVMMVMKEMDLGERGGIMESRLFRELFCGSSGAL
jgi:hypothetical protein